MPQRCNDVAIIGAGIAGALLADALAGHHLDVLVLEAGEAGRGRAAMPSGTSVPAAPSCSKMVMGIPETDAAELLRELGPAGLAAAIDLARRGRDRLFERVAALCPQAAVRLGSWAFCPADEVAALAAERAAFAAAGRPVLFDGLRFSAALPGARVGDAFFIADDGAVDGATAARCLLQASGCTLREGTVARSLKREGPRWRIETSGGPVLAGAVLVASNAAHGLPGLRSALLPRWTLLARWPCAGDDTPNLFTPGAGTIDLLRQGGWVRACGEDRDGPVPPSGRVLAERLQRLLRRVRQCLPMLAPAAQGGPVTGAGMGAGIEADTETDTETDTEAVIEVDVRRFARTRDGRPLVGLLAPGLGCMVGCNGMAHALWAAAAPVLLTAMGIAKGNGASAALLAAWAPQRFDGPGDRPWDGAEPVALGLRFS